jgi:hypothetical protein
VSQRYFAVRSPVPVPTAMPSISAIATPDSPDISGLPGFRACPTDEPKKTHNEDP